VNRQTEKKHFFNDSAFGWDGLTTFIFSNIVLLLTLGFAFIYLFAKTLAIARHSKVTPPMNSTLSSVLIAGLCLQHNLPTKEYKIRLQRVFELTQKFKQSINIIILGGITGKNTLSEAQAGANYLFEKGIPGTQIIVEEQSRHTLENLQNARSILNQPKHACITNSKQSIAIVSSRYHLYRILTLANGLGMNLQPVAAEAQFSWSLIILLRIMKEAYFLHWYWSGKLWVYMTANKKSKARIS